jgi:hypothetical protein
MASVATVVSSVALFWSIDELTADNPTVLVKVDIVLIVILLVKAIL